MNTTIFYVSVLVILVIIVVLIYYYLWLPRQNNTKKYNIPLLEKETVFTESYTNIIKLETLVTRDTLYVPKLGHGVTFSWEMYIPSQGGNDIWQTNFNTLKPIISMNDSPVISYHPKKNYLSISVKYRNNPFYSQFAEVKFTDIKLQCWNKYSVVIENRNIRLYINSILVSTKILPSIIAIGDIKSEIILGETNNNFLGKIKNLILYPYPLDFDEIQTI